MGNEREKKEKVVKMSFLCEEREAGSGPSSQGDRKLKVK